MSYFLLDSRGKRKSENSRLKGKTVIVARIIGSGPFDNIAVTIKGGIVHDKGLRIGFHTQVLADILWQISHFYLRSCSDGGTILISSQYFPQTPWIDDLLYALLLSQEQKLLF